jgi:hypothetical protein
MLKKTLCILFITSVYANDYPYPLLKKREASPRRNGNRNHHTKSHHRTKYDYYTRSDYL